MDKIFKYLSWVPFGVSIGALILYLRYFIMFKLDSNLVMTNEVKETLNGYLIIVFVALFIGLLIILFKKIFNLVNSGDKKEEIKEVKVSNTSNKEDNAFIDAIESNSRILLNVVDESNFMKYVKSNKVIKVKLSEPIIGQTVKGKVVDTDEEIEILLLDDEINDLTRCPKCNKMVSKDAFICTNCGVILNKEVLNDIVLDFNNEHEVVEVKRKKFNFALFLVNFMIIILCIFLIFLIGNKIVNQREMNINNINVVETK